MPRQPRKLSGTGIYHIMLRGNERKNIFQDRENKQKFLEGLKVKQKEIGFSLYAYCLMDNHVHLLLNVNNGDLASIMKGITVRYASFYNWKYDRVGHVFQDRFKSEPIEDERYLLAAIRYIHNNPVKAGLLTKISDYKWSSFHMYIEPINETLIDTTLALSLFSDNRNVAIMDFQRFSMKSDQQTFLDMEDEKTIRTLQEGKVFLEEYIHKKALKMEISKIKEDKQLRNEIILYLLVKTSLSQRIIAQLLGVTKGVIERVKQVKK